MQPPNHPEKRVLEILFEAFDELNQMLPPDRRIVKEADAVLYDPQGSIDSLGLTLLIVAVEGKIEKEFGRHVPLSGNFSLGDEQSHFRTVRSLADYITGMLGQHP
jgi:D-alanine--poly(phosphoribitol) ligase subunit 2